MVFKNNKGVSNIEFLIIGIGVLAFVGIVIFFVYQGLHSINDTLQDGDMLNTKGKDYLQSQTTAYPGAWDGIYIFLLAGMTAFIWWRSYNAAESPLWLILGFLMLGVLLYVGAVLSNNFELIFNMSSFEEFQIYFPKMAWVLMHLVEVLFVQGLGAIIMGLVGANREAY